MSGPNVPKHPIPAMQAAFAESMAEASQQAEPTKSRPRLGTAESRRKELLDQDIPDTTHAARWKLRDGQQHHELWKLMSQISFGIYLLLNAIAKDEDQVMTILQGHVDEVDEFLEDTLEDFDLAQEDIVERLKFLKLPLENIDIFDAMLEDRAFRMQIVTGNERIEHVIKRTARAMNDALLDVHQGLDACKAFNLYLDQMQQVPTWKEDRDDLEKVFEAMKGNLEGWSKAYNALQGKGHNLGVSLTQLGSIVAEMDKRAGEVSRKTRFSTTPQSTSARSSVHSSPSNTQANKASIPAFPMVVEREDSPDPETESEPDGLRIDTKLMLKPHIYSPVPSPRIATPAIELPASEPPLQKRSSLRERLSMRNKDVPAQVTIKSPSSGDSYWGPRQPVKSSSARANDGTATPQGRQNSVNPSHGPDSAYFSDVEKPFSPANNHSESPVRQVQYTMAPPRSIAHDAIPSPRSDHQYFRPIQVSPNLPLQRPWTAGNNPQYLSANSIHGDRLAAPSAMGMSVRSGATVGVDANGKKLRKKKSAFGWLKKAFALDPEERAAFEEKRRAGNSYAYHDRDPETPRYLDGRRIG